MNQQSKLNQQTPQQAQELAAANGQQTASEFNTAEELIRHDASQVTPPPFILTRLIDSIAQEPKLSWWQRMFSRNTPDS